ncbi:hypothetical protein WJ0W_002535 [Paenibacillus melissococcoides]|uniref:Xylose isomerase-like TIM barrel domain-containing protein n=1 Tax=Paenibacillus melissococcoides TaxID=2912268 RepID=A0ABN8U2K3_9BACL|nr:MULTISPECIES: hypothetical protein [Paenibacillus]MEB9894018.1 hypothetical protein [Bacillus cereus]CAH8245300.1 hypothetical protein WJ0W_002535 [Paenibacillus melissococcoides]CAH8710564.1 hypothetical protein WDD9_002616 [Paenibacillus melissococcoides]CAH8711334.1 hypothetical protein HTL2_002916 [Paenibacillus melissococcoides]GIO82632.1 hypothetical protein J6TS7_62420 [Paenibacillus dendritiformis]
MNWLPDTARLDVSKRVFPEEGNFHHHLPVLPEQNGDGRYGEAFGYLEALASRNPAFHVTFEHRAELASMEELDAIYERVALLLSRTTGHTDTPCRNIMRI